MSASSLLIIGHTAASRTLHRSGMGEIPLLEQFHELLLNLSIPHKILDLYELFGGGRAGWEALRRQSQPNLLRALLMEPFQWEGPEKERHKLLERIRQAAAPLPHPALFLWTMEEPLAALLAAHLDEEFPLISHLMLAQSSHRILTPLYASSTLVTASSPLALQCWKEGGHPPEKIHFFPRFLSPRLEEVRKIPQAEILQWKKGYLKKIIRSCRSPMGSKEIPLLALCTARFLPVKNIDSLLRIFQRVHCTFPDAALLLKGRYDSSWDFREATGWTRALASQIAQGIQEGWLLWDWEFSPPEELYRINRSCDLAINLSGSEVASTVTIEQTALGLPTLMLEATTHPSLFHDLVLFTPHSGELHARLFPSLSYRPNEEAAVDRLSTLLHSSSLRHQLSHQAEEGAKERFSLLQAEQQIKILIKLRSCNKRKK